MFSKSIIKKIKLDIDDLMNKGLILNKVILFVSHTKNQAHRDSDIDLMLISSVFDKDIDKYIHMIWLSDYRTDYNIEPIPVGLKRFLADDSSPIISIAKLEGIEIEFS